jgi:hypothetical protein
MATRASPDGVYTAPAVAYPADKSEIGQVERVMSGEDEKMDHVNYDRIDAEVAKYADANAEQVHISEEENRRLKKLIDRRVLPIMIVTYFLQALDKGTMSFSSIMGIRNDIPILKQNFYVCYHCATISLCSVLIPKSGDGSPPVSTSPFSSSNIPSIGQSSAYPSANSLRSTSCAGQQYCVATLSASAFPLSWQSELCLVSSKLCVNLLS